MDILQETKDLQKKTFLSHVFSTTEEGKAEILNVVQYSLMGVIPIVLLNKLIQRFIPEADADKSSVEITIEILIQLIVMFVGIIIIHRVITYFPSYSGFKYDNLILTNVILAFLIIVLSIQTKLGIKVNILVDRFNELWNGSNAQESKAVVKSSVKVSQPIAQHAPSQADYLDGPQTGMFPPAPIATSKPQTGSGYDYMMKGGSSMQPQFEQPIMAANTLLGSSFGAF